MSEEVRDALDAKILEVGPMDEAALDKALTSLELYKSAYPDKVGEIEQVAKLAPDVFEALKNSDAYAAAVRDLEAARLSLESPPATLAQQYVAAARKLAADRQIDVIELTWDPSTRKVIGRSTTGNVVHLDTDLDGLIKAPQFMDEVVGSGQWFVDYAALVLQGGDHGALTHIIQDLVVDGALRAHGSSAAEFRKLLKSLDSMRGFKEIGPGTDIWVATYDCFEGIANPDNLWPTIRDLLGIHRGEL